MTKISPGGSRVGRESPEGLVRFDSSQAIRFSLLLKKLAGHVGEGFIPARPTSNSDIRNLEI